MLDNEDRANLGVLAVEVAARRTGVWEGEYAVTAIEDVLAYIAHACDRFGLDPVDTFRDGLKSYRGDFEDEPKARLIARGEQVTLDECAGRRGLRVITGGAA
jgi:hypothetical protein